VKSGRFVVRQLRGLLPLAGWHAHSLVAAATRLCVGMLGAGVRACPANGVLGMPPPKLTPYDAQPENTCRIMKTRENRSQDAHDDRWKFWLTHVGTEIGGRSHDRRARALPRAVSVVAWPMQRMKGRIYADHEQAPVP